jgi:anti-sigma regulatory factor (Ser/Thr protein kinase)
MMELCDEPRHMEDVPVLQIALDCNPEAPSLARAAIVGFFGSEIDQGALGTLTLLVSELVANAVLHSHAPPASEILLRARLFDRGALRVEVTDEGDGFTPVPRDPNEHGGGYGLYLVDTQATSWGVDQEDGTRVWFEMGSLPNDQR